MKNDVPQIRHITDAKLVFWPEIIHKNSCELLYHQLLEKLPWRQDSITLFGKNHPLPRLQVWMGDPEMNYRYSGLILEPIPWCSTVRIIKRRIESICGHHFNSVLINLYRTGQDSNGWHSDDEPELGENPVIASFSLGATRRFRLRHKHQKDLSSHSFNLSSGSLLIMAGTTQKYWQHSLPKTAKTVKPRINLTFRTVKKIKPFQG